MSGRDLSKREQKDLPRAASQTRVQILRSLLRIAQRFR
jgi:hypothetical protein